jgi:hypothetical protein
VGGGGGGGALGEPAESGEQEGERGKGSLAEGLGLDHKM